MQTEKPWINWGKDEKRGKTLINWRGNCLVPVRRFPSPSRSIRFSDVSETNGRETPRQKQNAHACVAFFKMADFVELFRML